MSPARALALTVISAAFGSAQSFDVATIKPNAESDNRVMIRLQPGGRFTASGMNLKHLIGQAYDVRDFQISGGPGWISSDRWEINAKAEGLPERVAPGALRPYLKSLLEDRFKLRTHTETKEMPVYALVVSKNGPKLSAAQDSSGPGPMIRMGRGQLDGRRMAMSMLAQQLAQQLGRPVIDKTGLTGQYDIILNWTPEPGQGGGPFGGPPPPDAIQAADSSGPSIFTALQEQLGLRLESQKGPVPILVIDSVEKPSEN
jgi:bla regulator protein blaR1